MKKLILATLLLMGTSSLFADYELFTSYTKPLNQIKAVKSEMVFSGTYEDYAKEIGSGTGTASALGVLTGATMGGLAGGLAGGALYAIAMEMTKDEQFIQVTKISDGQGNYTLKRTLLVSDKHPDLSVSEATQIMKRGK